MYLDHSYTSPNYSSRGGADVAQITIHTTEGAYPSDVEWLCNPQTSGQYSPVSCHYVVAPGGLIHQIVDDIYAAWHAGSGSWLGVTDVNKVSIGIEVSHLQGQPYPSGQIAATTELVAYLIDLHGIAQAGIAAHRWVAPDRKIDPTNVSDSMLQSWIASFYAGVDYAKYWGGYWPYVPDFGITQTWQDHYQVLGQAMTDEQGMSDGRVLRAFEHGAVVWSSSGDIEVWL